jgi:hypothetical protein
VISKVREMAAASDYERLNGLWQILGGGGDLFVGGLGDRDAHVNRLLSVIHDACGKGKDGDPYLAERRALTELARQVSVKGLSVDPGEHPDVIGLELAILRTLTQRLALSYTAEDRRPNEGKVSSPPIEGTVDRLRPDERSRLTMQTLDGYASMPDAQQRSFRSALAERTDSTEAELAAALTKSPNALLSLLEVDKNKKPRDIATAVVVATATVLAGPGGFTALTAASTATSFVMGPGALILVPVEGLNAKGLNERLNGRQRAKARTLIQIISYLHAGTDHT